MSDVAIETLDEQPPRRRLRRDWPRRLVNELLALFIALLFLFAGLLIILDSAPALTPATIAPANYLDASKQPKLNSTSL